MEAGICLRGSEVVAARGARPVRRRQRVDRPGRGVGHGHPRPTVVDVGHHVGPRTRPAPQPLLHKHEIEKLDVRQGAERLAIVPLSLYWKDGRVKVEIAVGRAAPAGGQAPGAGQGDAELDMRRAMARNRSGKSVYEPVGSPGLLSIRG